MSFQLPDLSQFDGTDNSGDYTDPSTGLQYSLNPSPPVTQAPAASEVGTSNGLSDLVNGINSIGTALGSVAGAATGVQGAIGQIQSVFGGPTSAPTSTGPVASQAGSTQPAMSPMVIIIVIAAVLLLSK